MRISNDLDPLGSAQQAASGGNIGAADVELTGDDLADIDRALSTIPIHGDRYPEALEHLSHR
jgi:hypothetical protein